MRARLLVAAGTAALALGGSVFAASPALAVGCTVNDTCVDSTAVTFTLTAGVLAIDAPTSASLASVSTSSTATQATGNLGTTTVTDNRAGVLAAYTVALTSGNFTTGGSTAQETIQGSTVTGYSGTVTHTNATLTKVPLGTTSTAPVAAPVPIMGLSAYTGTDVASYNPGVIIPIPATNAAGLYSGTITQTVTAV
jgi:hypothetical protein